MTKKKHCELKLRRFKGRGSRQLRARQKVQNIMHKIGLICAVCTKSGKATQSHTSPMTQLLQSLSSSSFDGSMLQFAWGLWWLTFSFSQIHFKKNSHLNFHWYINSSTYMIVKETLHACDLTYFARPLVDTPQWIVSFDTKDERYSTNRSRHVWHPDRQRGHVPKSQKPCNLRWHHGHAMVQLGQLPPLV